MYRVLTHRTQICVIDELDYSYRIYLTYSTYHQMLDKRLSKQQINIRQLINLIKNIKPRREPSNRKWLKELQRPWSEHIMQGKKISPSKINLSSVTMLKLEWCWPLTLIDLLCMFVFQRSTACLSWKRQRQTRLMWSWLSRRSSQVSVTFVVIFQCIYLILKCVLVLKRSTV